ncbi:MAG: cryptochrome/photolyase family protein [Planktomarina sp.]
MTTLVWFRRDFRLTDHAALTAAADRGGPVVCVFVNDAHVDSLGAAPKWRMGLAVEQFAKTLEAMGQKLILRTGAGDDVIPALAAEVGADAVYWSRSYDPTVQVVDAKVKEKLKMAGFEAASFKGHLIFEPWTVETKTGGFYKVFTPLWKTVRHWDMPKPLTKVTWMPAPKQFPPSENLNDWQLGAAMKRGADIVLPYTTVGEEKAQDRLDLFLTERVQGYPTNRDLPWKDGTSRLSENLTHGEISPLQCWHAGWRAFHGGDAGAEVFVKEIVWREFAYHLLHHTPHIATDNWKPDWDAFPWNTDETSGKVVAWVQGRTGIQFVDAAMREMYVTGTMHNRGRMIVASYLTKHLLTDWKIGMNWFADCLIDWDPASNAMGWQWSSGSGPDATPYFRVFNPVTQLDKFDKNRAYVGAWLAEGKANPSDTALSYFDAVPKAWGLSATDAYPAPIVPADQGRKIALDAYANRGF